MTFETVIIISLVVIIGLLIWMILGLEDDKHRLQTALHEAIGFLTPCEIEKVDIAYMMAEVDD